MKNNIGREFMRLTKYEHLSVPLQEQGLVPQPPLELAAEEKLELIKLPSGKALSLSPLDLVDLVEKRASLRKYTNTPLSLEELSFLLWGTQGVKRITSRPSTIRTVPSAGARHPFETYLLVNNVTGLAAGLYRYAASAHALVHMPEDDRINEKLTAACLDQKHVQNSAVTFIWAAIPFRTEWRYSERSYRYLHLDAGHVCQNLYLLAEAIDCGVCAIAAFDDDKSNQAIGVDGEDQFVIYMATLGKRI